MVIDLFDRTLNGLERLLALYSLHDRRSGGRYGETRLSISSVQISPFLRVRPTKDH